MAAVALRALAGALDGADTSSRGETVAGSKLAETVFASATSDVGCNGAELTGAD